VQLEVVGTVFNVRRAGQGLRVTVLEGKVTVRPGTHSNPVMLTSGYEIESIAGVLATAQRATDLEATLAWREGRLVFNNIRLDQALAEAQRYRRAPIVIADAGVSGLRITGAFPTNDPDRLLKLLPEALPVRVSLLDDGTARVSLRKPDSKAPKIRQEIHAPVLLPRSSE
jgi:transmembrane sensor